MPNDRGGHGGSACFRAALIGAALAVTGLPAGAEAPLSAIDWLSQSVATPNGAVVETPKTGKPAGRVEAPVSPDGALPEDVAVSTLDAPSPDGAGLFSPAVTGLPRDLWGMGLETEIAARISAESPEPLPALQGLLMMLLLAEAAPPADSAGKGNLLLSRTDKLLDIGALDQAQALIDSSGLNDPPMFRRAFDIALLTGNEDRGCEMMQALPNLAPTFPARIFCLARSGDWNAAALTLRTAQALGQIGDEEDLLLSRFLDPDLYEGETMDLSALRVSPLTWRLLEAIGEPMPTATLPLAFAHAELRETAGWKTQIEAAERLCRVGAISPNLLLGLYTERLPAASGGVWTRVDAVQRFDTALRAGDPGAVAKSLPTAWSAMTEAELEVPFALLFADALSRLPLSGEADAIAFEVALLSDRYETVAKARKPQSPREAFLIGLATGNLAGAVPQDSLGRAIAPAFLRPELTADMQALLDQRRLGEALLIAIGQIGSGLEGQLADVTAGLSLLRQAGLEDVARRTALQLVLLERRG